MQAANVRYSHPNDNMFSAFCHLFFVFFAKKFSIMIKKLIKSV